MKNYILLNKNKDVYEGKITEIKLLSGHVEKNSDHKCRRGWGTTDRKYQLLISGFQNHGIIQSPNPTWSSLPLLDADEGSLPPPPDHHFLRLLQFFYAPHRLIRNPSCGFGFFLTFDGIKECYYSGIELLIFCFWRGRLLFREGVRQLPKHHPNS